MSHGTVEEFLADGVILFYNLQVRQYKAECLEIPEDEVDKAQEEDCRV